MSKELSAPSLAIAVAVYVPEQYARLLAIAEDASDLEATWQEWHQVLQDTKQKMAAPGMYLIDVTVDLFGDIIGSDIHRRLIIKGPIPG